MRYIDFHCDMLYRIYYKAGTTPQETIWHNNGHVDLSRLTDAGYLAQFFACFLDQSKQPKTGTHYGDVLEMIGLFKKGLPQSPGARLCTSAADYIKNKKENTLSCFLTVEEGGILENDLSRLDTLYKEGIRLITLTWNYENCLGFPHNMSQLPNTGLKPFGHEVIREMQRLGILIDVSHLSDAGFEDVYRSTTIPFVASHSCCRSLCAHSRNLTDDMIRKIGDRQGIVGINFYGPFLSPDGRSTTEAITTHLRHLINTGGLDIAALGSDFDGIEGPLEIPGCHQINNLIPTLEKAHFTPLEIDAICHRNMERILTQL